MQLYALEPLFKIFYTFACKRFPGKNCRQIGSFENEDPKSQKRRPLNLENEAPKNSKPVCPL